MVNFHVLKFDGEIDIAQRQRLNSELAVIDDFDPESIVILDLSNVKYVDSTLLNAMIRIRNRSHGGLGNGKIRLVAHPDNNIRKLLAITKFDLIFPTFDDLAAARNGIVYTDTPALVAPSREAP